jgi:hypothetical protein
VIVDVRNDFDHCGASVSALKKSQSFKQSFSFKKTQFKQNVFSAWKPPPKKLRQPQTNANYINPVLYLILIKII